MTVYLANFAPTLTSTVSFSPTVNWVLSGTYKVPATLTSISAVQTLVATCFSTVAPFVVTTTFHNIPTGIKLEGSATGRAADVASVGCFQIDTSAGATSPALAGEGADYFSFATLTSTNLSTPLAVSPGQIITVTAAITFS